MMEREQHPKISIHALREEGDPDIEPRASNDCSISIHALREEGDQHFHHL